MIVLSLLLVAILALRGLNIFLSGWSLSPTRTSVLGTGVRSLYKGLLLDGLAGFILGSLLVRVGCLNLVGSLPGVANPNMYYFFTTGLSLTLWLVVVTLVLGSQLVSFLSHLLPYGTPRGLALLLPIIELFRFLIRPFTLMVRLSTNLSSGHIMLFIFSYFAVASKSLPVLSVLMGILIFLLYGLELFVCFLQAYIFASLLSLYYGETV